MGMGKFNVKLAFFAVLGYVFVLIGAEQSLMLLAGFLIIAEKNRKATTQVVQAVALYVLNSVLVLMITGIMVGMADTLNSFGLYTASTRITELVLRANGFINGLVWVAAGACIVFVLIGKPFEVQIVGKIFGDAENTEVIKEDKTVEV